MGRSRCSSSSSDAGSSGSAAKVRKRRRLAVLVSTITLLQLTRSKSVKRICDPDRGLRFVNEILNSQHPERCLDRFRMSAAGFLKLESLLRTNPELKETHRMPLRLQLAIYLDWIAHGRTYRDQIEIFQVGNSQITFSRYNMSLVIVECNYRTCFDV